jgi:hypothetical protein
MDKILLEHPIAAWTLDEDFVSTDPLTSLNSFYNISAVAIPTQTNSNGGGYMSFTTSTAHGLVAGDYVSIYGVTPSHYNGTWKIYSVGSTTSFTIARNPALTGTITVAGFAKKQIMAYELTAYNTERYPGYVWATNPLSNKVPMAYGSGKSQSGSFIIPSFGFLSNKGRYNQYTFETWVKIKRTNNTDKYKLVGLFDNTATTDDGNGLYYNDTSFILKIGNKSGSGFIKQSNKPLLIQITYSENSASLFVNGEQIVNLVLEESDIELLATPSNDKEYISLQSATFDCPAIYPYQLSATQIKVHYAYGQAVSVPETINRALNGKNVSIDFPSAKYASGQNYPINSSWKNAVFDGIDVGQYAISNKKFDLPTFNVYDTSTETYQTKEWLVSKLTSSSWNTKTSSGLSTVNSNVQFQSLNLFNNPLKSFYADYSVQGTTPSTSEKTIFKIINKIDKNYLKITMQYVGSDIEIKYKFKYNSNTETLICTKTDAHYFDSTNYYLFVGMDIDKFASNYDNNIRNFFNNLDELTMFAFGDNDITLDTTPDVYINSIKFQTQFELDKIGSSFVDSTGRFFCPSNAVESPSSTEGLLSAATSSYQVFYATSKKTYNTSYTYSSSFTSENYFTYGSSGYWKDDTPLTHFAKYVKDENNDDVYTFNSIQFNVDYDAPVVNTTVSSGIKYFDTSKSNVKTYITFETINSPYKADSYFTNGTKQISIDRTVRPDANWATTKYEVVDGTIIYPPTGVDISTLTLIKHVDIKVADSINNKVTIKSLELASQALSLDPEISNPIYTKYGNSIIPYTYTLSGLTKVYDYSGVGNARNPFIIEKKTSPYLSLDRLSGIRLVGFDSAPSGVYRGIRVPLNEKASTKSKLSSIQMFVYYDATIDVNQSDRESFQFDSKEIFNIVAADRTLTATLTNTSGVSGTYNSSATISTTSTVGSTNQDIQYYINGELTSTPTINTNEWVMLTVVFTKALSFDSFTGEFNITGPLAMDNITFFGFSDQQYNMGEITATWEDVKTPVGGTNYKWNYWSIYFWSDLLTTHDSSSYPIEPSKIYGMYTGTNILYPGYSDPTKRTSVSDVQYTVYGDIRTSNYTYSAN